MQNTSVNAREISARAAKAAGEAHFHAKMCLELVDEMNFLIIWGDNEFDFDQPIAEYARELRNDEKEVANFNNKIAEWSESESENDECDEEWLALGSGLSPEWMKIRKELNKK